MKKIRLIESYLEGNISDNEKLELQQLVGDDKQLSSELNLIKEINEAILDDEAYEFRLKLNSLLEEEKNSKKSKSLTRSLKALKFPLAATILVLIGISLWQIFVFSKPAEVYASYYKPYLPDLTTRSNDDVAGNGLQLSFKLYQQGEYEASFEILHNYLSKNFDNQTARFFYSMNAIELGKYDLAISGLEEVEKDEGSLYSLHARWYLAMTYLKLEKPEDAIIYLNKLIAGENMYTEKAGKIIRKLKS